MHNKYIKIGIGLIAVSIFLFGAMATQTKVNINRIDPIDIAYACDQISGIGDVTAQELIKNRPITNIEAISTLPNIGKIKSKIINQHFTTVDTLRPRLFIFGILAAIILSVIGSALATYRVETIKKDEKRLDEAFFGKGK